MQEFWDIDTQVEVNRISVDVQGGAVAIDFSFEKLYAQIGSRGNDPTIYLRIKRGSHVIRTLRLKPTPQPSNVVYRSDLHNNGGGRYVIIYQYNTFDYDFITLPTIMDNPPSGTQTYTVTLESRGLNAGRASGQRAHHPVQILQEVCGF